MTVYEWAFEFLKERGMTEKQAFVVLEKATMHPAMSGIRERWGEDYETYPEPMKKLLVTVIRECALKWIEQEDPHAFFRPLFDGSVPT